MFQKIVIVSALVAVAFCASLPSGNEPVPIVSQESHVNPDGNFQFSYETGDGTHVEQSGTLVQLDKDNSAENVQGSVSYVDPEGKTHSLNYVANAEGYQPQGDDVPAVPEAIARSLEWNAAHPEPHSPEKH